MSLQPKEITIRSNNPPTDTLRDNNHDQDHNSIKNDDDASISTDTFSKISEWDILNSKFKMGSGSGSGNGPSSKQEHAKIKIIPPPACWYKFADMNQEKEQQQQQDSKGVVVEDDSHDIIQIKETSREITGGPCIENTNVTKCTKDENEIDTLSMMVVRNTTSCKVSHHVTQSKLHTASNTAPISCLPITLTMPTLSKVMGNNLNLLATVTTTVLSPLAQELISSTVLKAYHYTKLSYSTSKIFGKHYLNSSEIGNKVGGYNREVIREEGIRDHDTGKVLWKEGMILDSSGHLDWSQGRTRGGGGGGCNGTMEGTEDEMRLVLPAFSSLPWVDRQLVKEWRTCNYLNFDSHNDDDNDDVSDDDENSQNNKQTTKIQIPIVVVAVDDDWHQEDFEQARTLVPQPIPRPPWENASSCYACRRPFGAMLRHHCRLCGRSCCQTHSRWSHKLPHLGYSPDVPERVCAPCKHVLESQDLAERIAWRMARCRDYLGGKNGGSDLCPYFEIGIDTVEDAAARLTKAAIKMAKSIPLGAQATMTVETLDILRKHGLNGIYGLILRKEFLAAADLLCKVTGINKRVWPLSVHELSAAIFYALAQHRALRGIDPEREHRIHAIKVSAESNHNETPQMRSDLNHNGPDNIDDIPCDSEIREDESTSNSKHSCNILVDDTDDYDPTLETKPLEHSILSNETQTQQLENLKEQSDPENKTDGQRHSTFDPVCDYVSDELLSSLILYAPLALNFIYATNEVDMQLLAAQQGWRLLYAHLNQDDCTWGGQVADKPASALFIHSVKKVACFAVRGTATIHDVVTDIRAVPVQFPDNDMDGVHKIGNSSNDARDDGWMPISKGQGLALCGMAGAACNLFRENIDAILLLAREGYRIRLTGHSLGGSVAALLGTLIKRHFELHLPPTARDEKNDDILRVYSYGSPACADAQLSDYAQSYVINCVLHDDVIPRLTPTSIRALLKHLLYIRETWVKAHLTDDLMAITERAKTAWAPKLRSGFSLIHTGNPSIKVYRKLQAKGKSLRKKISKGSKKLRSMASQTSSKSSSRGKSDDHDSCHANMENEQVEEDANSTKDDQHSALFFEGECFYEAEESLIEQSDEESVAEEVSSQHCTDTNVTSSDLSFDSWTKFDERPSDEEDCHPSPKKDTDDNTKEEHIPPVLLEEAPLPRMFIPGQIVHIYTHRGAYKAAIVPKAFRELRRISMAGNMLNDHLSKSYYEALLECQTVRAAKTNLPSWTGFSEEMTCCCCASRFTWASTSDSEAQEARDRHNCRACGGLVCGPCSSNRLPLPDFGIHLPSRVCDRCYYAKGSSFVQGKVLSQSFTDDDTSEKEEDEEELRTMESNDKRWAVDSGCVLKKCKSPSKRSHLVDELAKRMPSAAV